MEQHAHNDPRVVLKRNRSIALKANGSHNPFLPAMNCSILPEGNSLLLPKRKSDLAIVMMTP